MPPKETARVRKHVPASVPTGKNGKKFDAFPDRIDIRDWFYRPQLGALPDQLVHCDAVPKILDQGEEGACTGFALAGVINYLLHERGVRRFVSPRMLYEIARRYDEWPGESYEGSSARGAMKGWVRHGVCGEGSWAANQHGVSHLTPEISREAQNTPGGAYYRVMHRQVRDVHAALAEVGAVYCTLMVHEGWYKPGPRKVTVRQRRGDLILPVIQRKSRAADGHAVAIVGYTREGFIILNSWGDGWGEKGFALLPYEDYMLHATDVWAAQLGVPVSADLWVGGQAADTSAGMQRAAAVIPLPEIRPYVVDVGNNGELSASGDYWTTARDLERLFTDLIPDRTRNWSKRRVMLYLHGGLNDEAAVARRIVAFRDVLLANEIYPVHIMWESGVVESLRGMIEDLFTDTDERARGIGEWIENLREGLDEAKDRTFELTAAVPGTALWNEMKENARLTSRHPKGTGGMELLVRQACLALDGLDAAERKAWELHVVAHSAGSIFAAYALTHLEKLSVSFKTVQFMAPAITTELFRELMLPSIQRGICPTPTLYILGDEDERSDTVGPYDKSLLYLVSNSFEGARETALLGMERFVNADRQLKRLFHGDVDGRPALVVAGRDGTPSGASGSKTHGGFDNDADTLNSALWRILNKKPSRPFTTRDLKY